MKVTVSQLRKIVREVLEESPPTRRGIGKGQGFSPATDDFPPDVPTQRGGVGFDKSVDSLFADWEKHMGRDPSAADRDVPVDDFGYPCAVCNEPMRVDQVTCPNCDAMSMSAPKTMRSAGVAEMKLSLGSGAGFGEPSLDDLFLAPEQSFERDTDADDDEDRRLDRDPEMQYADLALDPRRRRM